MSKTTTGLQERFGEALQTNVPLARFTAARLGGPADLLLVAEQRNQLVDAITLADAAGIPWRVLGGGANVLIADEGIRGLVVVNHTRHVDFGEDGCVVAESGVNLSTLARRCMKRGFAGLEWAVNVPGTVGGAVVNNAGAHGGDMADSLKWVELFSLESPPHPEMWTVGQLRYDYRTSVLKGTHGQFVVLGATLALETGHDPAELTAKADAFVAHRKRTQPPGASLGSIFKNPPDDYAGRLIEAAGLKGMTMGGVKVSSVHANFFVNKGGGTAHDYRALIEHVRRTVADKFGVMLDIEIECVGDWPDDAV